MEKILDKVNHLIEVHTEVSVQLGTETQRWKDDIGQLEKKVTECELVVDGCRIEAHSKIAECEAKIAELLERTKHFVSANMAVSRSDIWDLDEDNWPPLSGARPAVLSTKARLKKLL